MADNKIFETPGHQAVKSVARKLAPQPVREAVELLLPYYAEARAARRRRSLEELVHAFADAEDEEQIRERIEWLFEDDYRVDELLRHTNALTFEVHPSARRAYVALAADSMAQRISYDLARDLGRLLRQLSGRESPILARLVHSASGNAGQLNEGFARGLSNADKTVATRLVNRLIDAGLATPLRPPPRQLNPGTPAWGCKLDDAEMGLEPLVRYSALLNAG